MLPLGETCTRMTSPHFLPFGPFMLAGSVGQSGTRRKGFGSVGLGTGASLLAWPCAVATAARATRMEIANDAFTGTLRFLRFLGSDWQLFVDISYPRSCPVGWNACGRHEAV